MTMQSRAKVPPIPYAHKVARLMAGTAAPGVLQLQLVHGENRGTTISYLLTGRQLDELRAAVESAVSSRGDELDDAIMDDHRVDALAKSAGMPRATAAKAIVVLDHAPPGVKDAARKGEIGISEAHQRTKAAHRPKRNGAAKPTVPPTA